MKPWDEAFAQLCAHFGEAELVENTVRVEARKRGSLVWHLQTQAGYRWFEWQAGEGRFLDPHEDRLLPGVSLCPEADILAYRPGRRIVWKDPERPWIWKAFRKCKDLPPARHFQRVAAALGSDGRLVVPALCFHAPETAAIGLERIAGEPLQVAPESTSHWRTLGSEMARFQQVVPLAGLSLHSSVDEMDLLRELSERFQECAGGLPAGWQALFLQTHSAAHDFRGLDPVACHRDLHDGQVLVDGDRLGLLDMDLLCIADPALDLGNLTAHLLLRSLQNYEGTSQDSAHPIARALLEGYAPPQEELFFTALRFYQTTALLRLALVYSLRPKWRSLADQLLAYASQAICEIPHV